MKKILSIILTFAITAVCFSGCSDKTKPDADNPVTLTMWHVYGSQTKSPLNDAIDSLPVYDNASDIQSRFEQNVKLVLKSAHNQYVERTAKGVDKEAVLNELADVSLEELKRLSDKDM